MALLDRKPVLVMGAGAGIGALVLADLLAAGAPVRASARRPEAGRFPSGVDVRAADLTDRASLERAFDGVGQVFLFANRAGVEGVIDSARDAGVGRIVLLSSGSVVHEPSRGNAIAEEHREVEEAFAASGLDVVPVRPMVLATNALGWARPIAAGAPLALYRPEAVTAPIHERDVAAVVVAALRGTEGASAMLTGPESLTQAEQIAAIGRATGRDVELRALDREEALVHYGRFMPAHEAEAVLMYLDDAAAGRSPRTDAVRRILGRPATGFDAWAEEHADAFRPEG